MSLSLTSSISTSLVHIYHSSTPWATSLESLLRRERQSDCVCKRQFRVTVTEAFLKKHPTGGQSCISGKSKSKQKTTTDPACKKNTWQCLSLSEILSTTQHTQLRLSLFHVNMSSTFATLCHLQNKKCALSWKPQCVLTASSNPLVNLGCYSLFKHRHTSILFQTGTQSFFSIQGGFKIFFLLESHLLLIDLLLPLAQVSMSR